MRTIFRGSLDETLPRYKIVDCGAFCEVIFFTISPKNLLGDFFYSLNIQNETRRFNLREGITAKDDTLPPRFFDEPLGKDGRIIRREELQKMLQDYYVLRGWSDEGIPK